MRGKRILSTAMLILLFVFVFFTGAGIEFAARLGIRSPGTVKNKGTPVPYASGRKDIINEKKFYVRARRRRNIEMNQPVQQAFFKGIPVLMYHSIGYEKNNDLRVPRELFEKEMKYIRDHGYEAITLANLDYYIKNSIPAPTKSVVITFDDGYEDNFTSAYPILKKYGLRATIFVITGIIDKNNSYVTSTQLRELEGNGIDIESHTVYHEDLSLLSYNGQLRTLKDSKAYLEKLLDKNVRYAALPCGKYNSYTEKALKDAGYDMAFLTQPGWARPRQGIFTLHRVRVSSLTTMEGFPYLLS